MLECLFPSKIECIVCGDELSYERPHDMCYDCLKRLPKIIKECKKCGVSITGMGKYCLTCKERKFRFERGVSCFDYSGKMVSLIHTLKYGGGKYLAKPLASFMTDKFNEAGFEVDFIMPVPVGHQRAKERGYNQAALLAREVSITVGIEYADILERIKDTPTQAKLTQEERRHNLDGAFVVTDKTKVKGKNILVVDDIMTTGSTCDEIAKTLLKAGSKAVFVLTLAHTVLKYDGKVEVPHDF
jgi:ComF family protein